MEWIGDFDLAAMKPELPFGQAPYIVHGDVKLAQSNAILRYVARIAGLSGDNDAEFALSEMLIEEATDLYNMMVKANYSSDKGAAYTEMFAGPFKTQLEYLEKLLPGGETPYFKAGEKRLAGGIAIASAIDLACGMEPPLVDWMATNTPKLSAFMTAILASSAFPDSLKSMPAYFTRS